MLRIKTTLAPSKIHGLGVFADQPVKQGETVWEFDLALDLRIIDAVYQTMPQTARDYIARHCYINPAYPNTRVMCFDDARFINFGDAPNLMLAPYLNGKETSLIAARAIAVWDELTVGPETDADYARKMKSSALTKILPNG